MRFLQAKHYRDIGRSRACELIVLHSSENQEKPGKAYEVAQWFASEDAPESSAHFVVDSGEVVQCVDVDDIAWAAPGANHNGIQIEHVGFARQPPEDWADTYSKQMLELSARLAADLCFLHKIPAVFVSAEQLLGVGARGITRHADVSRAFRKSTHTDPGAGFPIAQYVERVAELLAERSPGAA